MEDDQISEFKSAFQFFGAQGDNLKKDDLRAILSKLSLPSNSDVVNKMVQEVDTAGTGSVDFTAFITMMSKKMRKADSEESVRNAFKVWDPKGTGSINVDDLYKNLTTLGDKLSEAEMGEVLNVPNVEKDGNFQYNDFIREMFGSKAGAAPAQ